MANSRINPITQYFTFEESGLSVPADTNVTRTYDLERDDWTHGICIIRNTSPNAATPSNLSREDEGGIFFFTTEASEASGESALSYRVQFSSSYNEHVIRPTIYHREIDSILSNRFLGQNDPGRRVLLLDMVINGSDLEIVYYPSAGTGGTVDAKLYVRVFNTVLGSTGFSELLMGGGSGGADSEASEADYDGDVYTAPLAPKKIGGGLGGGSL